MTASASGERRARFEAVFAATHRPVRAYALRRADPEVAQDAVAETFVVAWRRIDEVPDPPLPWLLGVTRRTLANARRAESRAGVLAERAGHDRYPALAADSADAVDDAAAMRSALGELSAADRETLMLVAWDGLEPVAAAAILGCSKASFAMRLHRARRRLGAALERAEGPIANDSPLLEAPR